MLKSNWDDSFWYNDAESMAIIIHNKRGGLEGYRTKIEEKPVDDEFSKPQNCRPSPSLIRAGLSFLHWFK
ncbi:hypothetical protein [Lyngbya sp. CCY1209]|uniref:hypothetical protein n=1 Tax=Lyngbya sp. CCY1209 TaxID=2886103 RepID=UPI002D21038D|nr:hypothetical protein [Lyngbya sp. CCY1209]MEB3886866.1 hypothetical protein [Lyngbya sp. CCY1209]